MAPCWAPASEEAVAHEEAECPLAQVSGSLPEGPGSERCRARVEFGYEGDGDAAAQARTWGLSCRDGRSPR